MLPLNTGAIFFQGYHGSSDYLITLMTLHITYAMAQLWFYISFLNILSKHNT